METSIKNINSLLQKITEISTNYKKLSRLSGEDFNLFKIINLTSDEVRVHSAFLAELLNPQGSHGQGNVFLKLFVNLFIEGTDFDFASANVKTEKYISKVERIKGGIIDIDIWDKNDFHIIIENKIDAKDQENQLIRYYNYGKDKKDFILFYLTLEGNLPDEEKSCCDKESKTALKESEDYFLLSYNIDILEWLTACREKAATHPTLREGITHYINLIKHLTHQSINKNMENEVIETLCYSSANIRAAFKIENYLPKAKTAVQLSFWKELENRLSKILEKRFVIEPHNLDENVKNYYTNKKGKNIPCFHIFVFKTENKTIYWEAGINQHFYTGFYVEDNKGKNISRKQDNKSLENIVHNGKLPYENGEGLGWRYSDPKLNFRNFSDEVIKLCDKKHLEEIIQKIADEAKNEIKRVETQLKNFFDV